MTAVDHEKYFYNHYFGYLDHDLSLFYDPLKKRLKNSRFKSISREYLSHLKESTIFKKDLMKYCLDGMIYDTLEDYPEKVLNKFKENKNFLEELHKNKSKFEWVKFELVAAIYHFLFFFHTSDTKVANLK